MIYNLIIGVPQRYTLLSIKNQIFQIIIAASIDINNRAIKSSRRVLRGITHDRNIIFVAGSVSYTAEIDIPTAVI